MYQGLLFFVLGLRPLETAYNKRVRFFGGLQQPPLVAMPGAYIKKVLLCLVPLFKQSLVKFNGVLCETLGGEYYYGGFFDLAERQKTAFIRYKREPFT